MSMKTTKYKLSDMAKDLKVTNNDLIECLGKLGGEPKKTQSVLTPEEISYVLEYYTQNNQVDSFDAFYANNVKPVKEEKKADKKPVKAEKKEKKVEKKPEPKPTPKAEAKPEPKPTPKAEAKPEPKAEPKVEKKPEVKAETKQPAPEQKKKHRSLQRRKSMAFVSSLAVFLIRKKLQADILSLRITIRSAHRELSTQEEAI